MRIAALVLCLTSLVLGCGRQQPTAVGAAVTVTNVVTVTREAVVTNVVTAMRTVTVTNVVVERREPERILTARKTAPYVASSAALDAGQFRKLLSESGARVVTCESGAVALVEASDKAVRAAGLFATVKPLAAEDKIAAGADGRVRVVPLSSIDLKPVGDAIRALGGRIERVVSTGSPSLTATMTRASIRKLAERGDVRRIEREDGK